MSTTRRIAHRLSAADVALLRAALADGKVARAAYGEWRRNLDWERLPAVWQRLLPLLHHNMARLGVQDALLERFRGVRRYFWARNLRVMGLAKRAHAALAEAGVPVLALKGTSLVASAYVDRSVRPMEDVDLLVRHAQVEAAIAVLERLGFEPDMTSRRCLTERLLKTRELPGCAFVDRDGDYVDLHWNALHLDRRREADEAAWARAREVRFEGVPVKVLDPTDQLLQLCAHGLQDNSPFSIRWIADAAIVIRGSPDLDWDGFIERAAHHGLSAAMAHALEQLLEILSVPLPRWVLDRLRQQSRPVERIEDRLRRGWPATEVGAARAIVDMNYLRRGRPDLFDRGLSSMLGPWLRATAGTRSTRAALGRCLHRALGRPSRLRRILAASHALDVPPAAERPVLDGRVDVTRGDTAETLYAHGWSIAERAGRWTDGRSATLAWRIANPRAAAVRVRLWAMPALNDEQPEMTVSVFAGDTPVGGEAYRYGHPLAPYIECTVPGRLIEDGALSLQIEISRPLVPCLFSPSIDRRELGILLQAIEVFAPD